MYVKEGQRFRALQNIWIFQCQASFRYHDPCTYVVAARVLPHRPSEQDLKQAAQRHHRVAVVGGNDFLQTDKSFTRRSVLVESMDRKNNKLKVHLCVDVGLWTFFVQSDTGRNASANGIQINTGASGTVPTSTD